MVKVYWSKQHIDIRKCLNDEPIKPYREPFINPFIDNSNISIIADNFQKWQMKEVIMNHCRAFGIHPKFFKWEFGNDVDEHKRKLACEALNEFINEYDNKIML